MGTRRLDGLEVGRDLGAQHAHALGERGIRLLDPLQVLGPGGEVVEAVGLEEQRGRVGIVALVHRDEAVGERVEGAAQAIARVGERRLGLGDLGVELGGALLAADERGGELGLALGGGLGLGLGGGELGALRVDVGREAAGLRLRVGDLRLEAGDRLPGGGTAATTAATAAARPARKAFWVWLGRFISSFAYGVSWRARAEELALRGFAIRPVVWVPRSGGRKSAGFGSIGRRR